MRCMVYILTPTASSLPFLPAFFKHDGQSVLGWFFTLCEPLRAPLTCCVVEHEDVRVDVRFTIPPAPVNWVYELMPSRMWCGWVPGLHAFMA